MIITAPSRLHFGMFSFGRPGTRQYGGVGAMIDTPGLRMRIEPADEFSVSGPLKDRAAEFAHRFAESQGLDHPPGGHLEILAAPPPHVGLGVGTQLGLTVARGLHELLGREPLEPTALAKTVGRGRRSAIGTHGFAHGGLLVESGKDESETLSPLAARVEMPAHWRFVLIRPQQDRGLAGDRERQAFVDLPPVPPATRERLYHEAMSHLVPAVTAERFDEFSASLYRYGHMAGTCFAEHQGGPFASPRLARLVETIRSLGLSGVGQSSWGPTLFAAAENKDQATEFLERFKSRVDTHDLDLQIAPPNNVGATIERG